MRDINLQSMRFNGINLHWMEKGEGDVVVFIPESNGDYRSWTNQFEEFAKKFRTIVVSRRYQFPDTYPKHGTSSVPENCDDLLQLFQHLKVSKATVVGHSFGGYISLAFAEQYPHLVENLVLEEPTVFTFITSNANNPIMLIPLVLQDLSVALSFIRSGFKGIKPARMYLRRGQLEKARLAFVDGIVGHKIKLSELNPILRQGLEDNIATFTGESQTAFSYQLTEQQLRNLQVKTLLLMSDKSPKWFAFICKKLNQLMPNTTLISIRSPTHWLHLDNSDEFNQIVMDFIHTK